MPVSGNQEFTFLVETAVPIIDPANCSGVRCETDSVSGNVMSYIKWYLALIFNTMFFGQQGTLKKSSVHFECVTVVHTTKNN